LVLHRATVVRLLAKVAERHPAGRSASLAFVTCASAPLRAEEVARFEESFGAPLLNCYGITETASWTAFSPRSAARDKASVGTTAGCEIRAVDSTGTSLPAGESGEIQIRGPSVMLGYYNDPEKTQAVLQDGWFGSGDQGYVDLEGRVFLLGRIKELIIRAGLKHLSRRSRRCADDSSRGGRSAERRARGSDPRREGSGVRGASRTAQWPARRS